VVASSIVTVPLNGNDDGSTTVAPANESFDGGAALAAAGRNSAPRARIATVSARRT
jgi:hypothetical protein